MDYGLDNAANRFFQAAAGAHLGQSANIAPPLENGYTLLTEPVQSRTRDHAFWADNSTTNGHHGDISNFPDARLDGNSGGYSHTSESNNAGAGWSSRTQTTSSTSTPRQANAGNNEWSLHQNPLDLLGIPRSFMETPVSSRSTSAAGRSSQATPNPASARGAWPQPANNSSNAQGGIPGSHDFPRSE